MQESTVNKQLLLTGMMILETLQNYFLLWNK